MCLLVRERRVLDKDDCQGGIDADQTVQYALDLAALGMPQDEIKKLMAEYPGGAVAKLSHNVFQGRLAHGVVTLVDHHDLHLVGDPIFMNYLDLSQTHMRMTLKPNGEADGYIAAINPGWRSFCRSGKPGLTLLQVTQQDGLRGR